MVNHPCHHHTRTVGPGLALARTTDPDTSHESAAATVREGNAVTIAEGVLSLLRVRPGLTAGEISDVLSALGYDQVWRRCSDLKRKGLIAEGEPRRWYRTNRLQVTLWPVTDEEQGRLL